MFDMLPGLPVRLRDIADSRGYPEDHATRTAADALDAAMATGTPEEKMAARTAAEAVYTAAITGV